MIYVEGLAFHKLEQERKEKRFYYENRRFRPCGRRPNHAPGTIFGIAETCIRLTWACQVTFLCLKKTTEHWNSENRKRSKQKNYEYCHMADTGSDHSDRTQRVFCRVGFLNLSKKPLKWEKTKILTVTVPNILYYLQTLRGDMSQKMRQNI